MTFLHVVILLALVPISLSIMSAIRYLQIEKEHTETANIWTPDHAVPLHRLFDGNLRFGSGSQDAVLWKNTHTPDEYQALDAMAHFFVVYGSQIRYLAIVSTSDGTVFGARMTISAKISDESFFESRNVTFDPVTGIVTAQYRRLLWPLLLAIFLPFAIWLFVSFMIGPNRWSRWNTPIFTPKRVPA